MNYEPNRAGDGVRFMGTRPIPRVDRLVPLFLRVRDTNGRLVSHTKQEWRELAAELRAVRANAVAKICEKKGK